MFMSWIAPTNLNPRLDWLNPGVWPWPYPSIPWKFPLSLPFLVSPIYRTNPNDHHIHQATPHPHPSTEFPVSTVLLQKGFDTWLGLLHLQQRADAMQHLHVRLAGPMLPSFWRCSTYPPSNTHGWPVKKHFGESIMVSCQHFGWTNWGKIHGPRRNWAPRFHLRPTWGRLGWLQWKSTLETKVFAPCSVGKSFPKPFWGILAVWRISKFFKKENYILGIWNNKKGSSKDLRWTRPQPRPRTRQRLPWSARCRTPSSDKLQNNDCTKNDNYCTTHMRIWKWYLWNRRVYTAMLFMQRTFYMTPQLPIEC